MLYTSLSTKIVDKVFTKKSLTGLLLFILSINLHAESKLDLKSEAERVSRERQAQYNSMISESKSILSESQKNLDRNKKNSDALMAETLEKNKAREAREALEAKETSGLNGYTSPLNTGRYYFKVSKASFNWGSKPLGKFKDETIVYSGNKRALDKYSKHLSNTTKDGWTQGLSRRSFDERTKLTTFKVRWEESSMPNRR